MDKDLEDFDFSATDVSKKVYKRTNQCNLCDYASSKAGNLNRHVKTHCIEKQNKCNQCNYASSDAGDLRTHLKTHTREKSNKCNHCDYVSSQAGHLRTHLKTHSGENLKCVLAKIVEERKKEV